MCTQRNYETKNERKSEGFATEKHRSWSVSCKTNGQREEKQLEFVAPVLVLTKSASHVTSPSAARPDVARCSVAADHGVLA